MHLLIDFLLTVIIDSSSIVNRWKIMWGLQWIYEGPSRLKEKFSIHIYVMQRGLIGKGGCLQLNFMQVTVYGLLIRQLWCRRQFGRNYLLVWALQVCNMDRWSILHYCKGDIEDAVSLSQFYITLIFLTLACFDLFIELVYLIQRWRVIPIFVCIR